MKIGCCVNYKNEKDLLACKRVGIDYIELAFNSFADASQEEMSRLSDFLCSEGIACECMNCLFPGKLKLVGEAVDYAVIDEYLEQNLEKIKPLNISVLVFGSGGSRSVPDGFSREKAAEQLIILLSDHIAPAIKKYHIVCAIEPLNTKECNIINTCLDGLEFVKKVGLPEIKLLSDFYHMNMNHENLESLLACAGNLEHIHIASALNDRSFPRRGDGEDYAGYFRILKEADYQNQRVSIEGRVHQNFDTDLEEAVSYLRNL